MINKKINKKELRDFGFIVGIILPFFIGLLMPILFNHAIRIWTFWVGALFVLISIFKPNFLFYPYKFWMRIGLILGFINSRIILGIIFCLVLLPISLIMILFGYDPLNKKFTKEFSYRKIKDNKINLKNIF